MSLLVLSFLPQSEMALVCDGAIVIIAYWASVQKKMISRGTRAAAQKQYGGF